ncbi:MAG: glycosyltransferase family 4 protein [Bacillota bacterium]
MKKILHVVENFGGAGLENIVKDLAIMSLSKDTEIYVCSLNSSGYCAEKVKDHGIEFYCLNRIREKKNDLSIIKELRKIIKSNDIDVVHAHNFTPLFYAYFSNIFNQSKLLVTFHGFIDWDNIKKIFYIIFIAKIDIVVVNEEMKNHYSFFRKKINVIFNGIELERFNVKKNKQLMQEVGLKETDFVIGSVGRLSPVKNQIFQLRAVAKLKNQIKNIKLLLVTGMSPDSASLMNDFLKEAESLGIKKNIVILGFRKDIPELLSLMDVFVMSSFTEGTSLALLEAMASGLPVVASNVGGNKKIVDSGSNGFLYDVRKNKEFIKLVLLLHENTDIRDKVANEALKYVEKFSLKKMVFKYNALYKKI